MTGNPGLGILRAVTRGGRWTAAAWVVVAFFLVGCKKSSPALAYLPPDNQLYAVVPSVGRVSQALGALEKRLSGTDGLRKAAFGWLGLGSVDQRSLARVGLNENSDLVWALRPGSVSLAFGNVDGAKLVSALRKRMVAEGYSLRAATDEVATYNDASGQSKSRVVETEAGVVVAAWSLVPVGRGPAPVPGLTSEAALDAAVSAWTVPAGTQKSIPEDALVVVRRPSNGSSRGAPAEIRQLLNLFPSGTLTLTADASHLELRLDGAIAALQSFQSFFQDVATAGGSDDTPSLASALPLDTTLVLSAAPNPEPLLKLPGFVREPILAHLRRVVILPGLPPVDLSKLVLPHIGGPLGLLAFGMRKDFRLRDALSANRDLGLADRVMRWGGFLTVKDSEAFLRAWAPVLAGLKTQGFEVRESKARGFKIIDLSLGKRVIASVLIRGHRVFLVRFKKDRQALLATAKGKRSALKKRLKDALGRDTVAGAGCRLCGYAQFVRLTRDLRRLGAPTFHLQLLGSIRQVILRLEPGKVDQRVRFRVDL